MAGGLAPKASAESNIVSFSDKPPVNYGVILPWVAACIALVGTLLFWLSDRNIQNLLAEKESQKSTITDQLQSKAYREVEQNSTDFQLAVTILKQAKKDRYAVNEFLRELYKHITNDVQLNNAALNDQGKLSMDGVTKSYRSIADLVIALKSWPILSNVKVTNVGLAVKQGVNQKDTGQARFTLTAQVDKSARLKAAQQEEVNNTTLDITTDASLNADASSPETTTTVPEPVFTEPATTNTTQQ